MDKNKQVIKSIAQAANEWLEVKRFEVGDSTLVGYRSKVNTINKGLGKCCVTQLTASDLNKWLVKQHKKYKNKSINEMLIVLRGVFNTALADQLIEVSPLVMISNFKVSKSEPNPFSKEEMRHLIRNNSAQSSGKNLFIFSCLTGLRISESIAITWEAISFERKELTVDLANVIGKYKKPKTEGSFRKVELNDHALRILAEQYQLTGSLKPKKIQVKLEDNKTVVRRTCRFVFNFDGSKRSFKSVTEYREHFFRDFCKDAGIDFRGPSQFRHTFASQLLSSGISKEWIAAQMGHTTTVMIDKHYGKWLRDDSPDFAKQAADSMNSIFKDEEIGTGIAVLNTTQDKVIDLSALTENPVVLQLLQQIARAGLSSSPTDLLIQSESQLVSQLVRKDN